MNDRHAEGASASEVSPEALEQLLSLELTPEDLDHIDRFAAALPRMDHGKMVKLGLDLSIHREVALNRACELDPNAPAEEALGAALSAYRLILYCRAIGTEMRRRWATGEEDPDAPIALH